MDSCKGKIILKHDHLALNFYYFLIINDVQHHDWKLLNLSCNRLRHCLRWGFVLLVCAESPSEFFWSLFFGVVHLSICKLLNTFNFVRTKLGSLLLGERDSDYMKKFFHKKALKKNIILKKRCTRKMKIAWKICQYNKIYDWYCLKLTH